MKKICFTYGGVRGCVDQHGFVLWNGMGFQVGAATGGLYFAIRNATRRS